MYVGFIDLEKAYDIVNREALWQLLRMYDVGGKLLSETNSMYVDSSACVREKGGENERFRIDSGVRQGFIMSLWMFSLYMDAVMKEVKMVMGRRGVISFGMGESGDYLVSCMWMTWFYMVSRRRT